MKVQIRAMREEDIEKVFLLEQRIFKDYWSLQSFLSEIENTDISRPIVMQLENQIVGYAVVWYYAGELHIANFAISPEFRRQGLGEQLLEHILQLEEDYRLAFLEVRKSNRPAIRLYAKYHFFELYSRERYYRDGEDAIIMVKRNNNIER